MELRIKTEPARKIISVDQMKEHLCLPSDFTEQKTTIENYIDAATTFIDGASGVLNRGLITQTWTGVLNSFPAVFLLPLPPVQSVAEIRYTDQAGDAQILAANQYRLSYENIEHQKAIVEPEDGVSWPTVDDVFGAVEIDFVVGYGTKSSDLPNKVIQLVRFLVSDMYERREARVEGSFQDNPIFKSMLNNSKFWEA